MLYLRAVSWALPQDIFDFATKVTTPYALGAFAIAGIIALIWLTRNKSGERHVPVGAWILLSLAIVTPVLGSIVTATRGMATAPPPAFDAYRVSVSVEDAKGRLLKDAAVVCSVNSLPEQRGGIWDFAIRKDAVPGNGEVTFYANAGSAWAKQNVKLGADASSTVTIAVPEETTSRPDITKALRLPKASSIASNTHTLAPAPAQSSPTSPTVSPVPKTAQPAQEPATKNKTSTEDASSTGPTPTSPPIEQTQSVEDHMAAGDKLFTSGDMAGAAREYKKAIELRPGDALAHDRLGHSLANQNDIAGWIREEREAVRINPRFEEAYQALGCALGMYLGDLDGMIVSEEEALQLDPSDALAHDQLGYAYEGKHRYADALSEYRTAVSLDPGNINYKNDLAHLKTVRK